VISTFALLLVLAADPPLPPGHPPIPGGSDAGPAAGSLPPGHPQIKPGMAAPSADELLRQLDATPDLKTRSKPFEVSAALGKLYFTHGRYPDAVVYFRQAQASAASVRVLYLGERRKVRGPAADAAGAGCRLSADFPPSAAAARAQEKAAAGDHLAAAACAREALGPVVEAVGLLGNALFLAGDAPGALAAYAWVLEVDATDPIALYGRAGVLFDTRPDDLAALRSAKKDLGDLLAHWPQIPQAPQARELLARTEELLKAGGATKFAASRPKAPAAGPASPHPPVAEVPALSPETMAGLQSVERTPELEKDLADLMDQGEAALVQGQYQAALDVYRRVMPLMPNSGRAKAGMAWALVELNRQPMADRVWGVAVESDPAAVDKLGDLLAKKGNAKDARALWAKLAASSPAYAQQANLQQKLR
jgi:tetratricopeptide (TPR) repeat protein